MKIRAHETFNLRKGWLRKGVKNILNDPTLFTNKNINTCNQLGIGTNMVKSLRYWLIATGITEEAIDKGKHIQKLTKLGELINNYDKYFEEDGTQWLIQYKLATNKDNATAWYWFFNEFNVQEFDKELFVKELDDYLEAEEFSCSAKMLTDEYACLLNTYYSKNKEEDPEETNSCPLTSLKLIIKSEGSVYRKNVPARDGIPPLIALAVIVAENKSNEINISELIDKTNSISKIFNLDRSTLFYILEALVKMDMITMPRTAGLDVVRFSEVYTFDGLVEKYYKSLNGK